MIWNKALETGVPQIDEQHKELFRRLDMLLDNNNPDRVLTTIAFIDEYVVKHFRDEETMQAQCNYPKAAAHKGYHEAYKKAFNKLKEQITAEGPRLTTTLALYKNVTDWLNDHILVHDKEFAQYYKNRI